MKLHEEFEKYNLFRTPDWRIARVLEMLDRFPTPGRCTWRDDAIVKQARKFVACWRACADDQERRVKLFAGNKGLFFAYQLHENAENNPEQLLQIQARILARQSYEEIADAAGTHPETVDWYEKVYFNVTDRLDQRDWISKHVLIPAFVRNAGHPAVHDIDGISVKPFTDSTVARPFFDATLKLFAYFGGRHVVDILLNGLPVGKPCRSQDDMEQWFDAGWAVTMRRRSHQAAMQFDVNRYNVMELFAVHTRIIEIEKSADNQASQRSTTERHIKAMLDGIPWAVGDDGERMAQGTALGEFDKAAAELRDDEVLQVAATNGKGNSTSSLEMLPALPAPAKKKPTLDNLGPNSLMPDDK